jgi:hypothetical protein
VGIARTLRESQKAKRLKSRAKAKATREANQQKKNLHPYSISQPLITDHPRSDDDINIEAEYQGDSDSDNGDHHVFSHPAPPSPPHAQCPDRLKRQRVE